MKISKVRNQIAKLRSYTSYVHSKRLNNWSIDEREDVLTKTYITYETYNISFCYEEKHYVNSRHGVPECGLDL